MRSVSVLIGLAMTVTSAPALAGNDVVAPFYFSVSGPVDEQNPPEWDLFFSVGDPNQPNPVGYMSGVTLDLADIIQGTVHYLTGDLAGAAAELTNGVDSPLYFGSTVAPPINEYVLMLPESTAFAGWPGLNGPDLTGFSITGISVLGTGFNSGDEMYTATFQFTFHGAPIPAPGAVGMFAMAGVGGMRRRR